MLADIEFGFFNSTNVRSIEITEVSYLLAISHKYYTTEIISFYFWMYHIILIHHGLHGTKGGKSWYETSLQERHYYKLSCLYIFCI